MTERNHQEYRFPLTRCAVSLNRSHWQSKPTL